MKIKENELYFAKTMDTAIIPTKRDEDAGYDIYAGDRDTTLLILPNSMIKINTGVSSAFSKDYVALYFDRSNMGKDNIKVCGGVIDSGYRGPHYVTLANLNSDKCVILTTQSEEEIVDLPYFDTEENAFTLFPSDNTILKARCVIKSIKKAIVQLLIVPVPSMKTKEISLEKLEKIESNRGKGWAR